MPRLISHRRQFHKLRDNPSFVNWFRFGGPTAVERISLRIACKNCPSFRDRNRSISYALMVGYYGLWQPPFVRKKQDTILAWWFSNLFKLLQRFSYFFLSFLVTLEEAMFLWMLLGRHSETGINALESEMRKSCVQCNTSGDWWMRKEGVVGIVYCCCYNRVCNKCSYWYIHTRHSTKLHRKITDLIIHFKVESYERKSSNANFPVKIKPSLIHEAFMTGSVLLCMHVSL